MKDMIEQLREVIRRVDQVIEAAREAAKAIEDANQDDEVCVLARYPLSMQAIGEIDGDVRRAIEQKMVIQIRVSALERMVEQTRQNHPIVNLTRSDFAEDADRR